jgi:predicted nucleic acid-binding protein
LAELADGRSKGLSCYEIKNRRVATLARIGAALLLGSESPELKQMQFRFIDADEARALNLTVEQKNGALSVDTELNKLHWEITGVNGPTAVDLMRKMKSKVQIISRDDILRQVVRGLRSGYISAKRVKGNLTKEIAKIYLDKLCKKAKLARH